MFNHYNFYFVFFKIKIFECLKFMIFNVNRKQIDITV